MSRGCIGLAFVTSPGWAGPSAEGPLFSSTRLPHRPGRTPSVEHEISNTMIDTNDLDWLVSALKGVGAAVGVTIVVALLTVWL